MIRSLSVAVVGVALLAMVGLTACSSKVLELDAAPDASVTQEAPSVWVAPTDSPPAGSGDSSTESTDISQATDDPLPGLSAECSSTIQAQHAINTLFTDAISATTAQKPDVEKITSEPASDADDSDTPHEPAPGSLTMADVQTVFSSLDDSIPAIVLKNINVLEASAERAVGEDAVAIAGILSEPEVRNALDAVNAYISDCRPAESE